jgi:hypothetical protein
MLTTQSPIALPRIHSLYSELPPNSRRAANLPFFVPRALPAPASAPGPTSCASNSGSASGAPPCLPRRNSTTRRNAISYHPPSSEELSSVRPSSPLPSPVAPTPRHHRPALLLASGYTSEPKMISSSSHTAVVPLVVSLAPARVPRSQREYQAKMVANLLLNRAGRARPMRCARRGSFIRAGYQPSRLSMCVLSSDEGDAASDSDSEGESAN